MKRLRRIVRGLERWKAAHEQYGHASPQAKAAAAHVLPMLAANRELVISVLRGYKHEILIRYAIYRINNLADIHEAGESVTGYWTAFQDLTLARLGWPVTLRHVNLINALKEALEK
jgi:hypothetical protein